MAAWLTANLTKEGHQVALLSGEMTVEQRAAVIERYRNGKEKVLVTTNVCSRGESNKRSQVSGFGAHCKPTGGSVDHRNRCGTSDTGGEL